MYRLDPAQGRGAYRDRHERGPDGGGRRSHPARRVLQGGQPWARRLVHTTGVILAYGKIVWSWRPESVRQVLWW